jgi:hypothetical protein
MIDVHLYLAPEKGDSKGQVLDPARQARVETEPVAVVPHSAQPLHRRQPRAREGADVHAVAHVVLEVVQVHERGLGEICVRQVEVSDLGRDDRLRARGQR